MHVFGARAIEPEEDLTAVSGNRHRCAPRAGDDAAGGVRSGCTCAPLGRSRDAEISFSDSYASGVHARVYPRGDRFFVEDMNSTNGTLLNGAPVYGETELVDGSRIAIGDTTFRFETGGRGR